MRWLWKKIALMNSFIVDYPLSHIVRKTDAPSLNVVSEPLLMQTYGGRERSNQCKKTARNRKMLQKRTKGTLRKKRNCPKM